MDDAVGARASFWDRRFAREGRVWGERPAGAAVLAAAEFRRRGVVDVLVPGCAYGRHSTYLSAQGFAVTGVDLSEVAVGMAESWATDLGSSARHRSGDLLALPYADATFGGVFAFSVLHLFLRDGRARAARELGRVLRPGGVLVAAAFSTDDEEFGLGLQVEENTFDAKGGRPAHFFTPAELGSLFPELAVERVETVVEPEDHGGRPHEHHLLLLVASRPA